MSTPDLSNLTNRQRRAYTLAVLEQTPPADAAAILAISVKVFLALLLRANDRLRMKPGATTRFKAYDRLMADAPRCGCGLMIDDAHRGCDLPERSTARRFDTVFPVTP